jgi:hypothetical protein
MKIEGKVEVNVKVRLEVKVQVEVNVENQRPRENIYFFTESRFEEDEEL